MATRSARDFIVRDRQRADCQRSSTPTTAAPNFAVDPTNGQPLPTYEQALPALLRRRRRCQRGWRAGFTGSATRPSVIQEFADRSSSSTCRARWQTSIGIQRQFGGTIAVEVDYVYQPGARRKGRHRQRQPDLQPGDRRQLPVVGPGPPVVSRLGHRLDEHAHGRSAYHGAADALQQAIQQPLAGVGDLHAVGTLELPTPTRSGPAVRCRSRRSPISAVNGGSRPTISVIASCSTASGRSATASR